MATDIEFKTILETFMFDISNRMTRVEDSHQKIVEQTHQFDKELSGLQRDIKYIREGQDQMKSGINKLLWGILAVLVTYVMGFIVQGGLMTAGG